VIRYESVYAAWATFDKRLTEISAGFEKIPAGSRIMAVSGKLADVTLNLVRQRNRVRTGLITAN
jgi:hypothetical protein